MQNVLIANLSTAVFVCSLFVFFFFFGRFDFTFTADFTLQPVSAFCFALVVSFLPPTDTLSCRSYTRKKKRKENPR